MNHATFPLNIKSLSEAGQIEGLAAGYGNMDSHGEIFAPGTFSKSIAAFGAAGRSPAMLLHHDVKRPVGRWDAFTESRAGMSVRGALTLDAADGREAYALLKGGALGGLSVGFRTIRANEAKDGTTIITEAELFEVSLVSVPSNPITKISGVKAVGDVRELESLLREAGMSGRRAKAAASAAWAAAYRPSEDEARAAILAKLSKSTRAIAAIMKG